MEEFLDRARLFLITLYYVNVVIMQSDCTECNSK